MRLINTFIIYLPAVPIAGWGVSCRQKMIKFTLKILKTDVFLGGEHCRREKIFDLLGRNLQGKRRLTIVHILGKSHMMAWVFD